MQTRLPGTFLLSALLISGLAAPVLAQAKASLVKVEDTLTTRDGWTLPIGYYPINDREAPVVVMLHGKGGNKLVWEKGVGGIKGLAEVLHGEKFAVITIDLRKHGKSKPVGTGSDTSRINPRADYALMVVQDLEAVKDFIYAEHQKGNLNMRKTGIVAADFTTTLAALFTVNDWAKTPWPDAPTLAACTPRGQDVRAVVMLSPEEALTGVNAGPAFRMLGTPALSVSFLLAVGTDDKLDRNDTDSIHTKLTAVANENPERKIYLRKYTTKARGTDLLGISSIKLIPEMTVFLKQNLMELPHKWVDRQSKLLE